MQHKPHAAKPDDDRVEGQIQVEPGRITLDGYNIIPAIRKWFSRREGKTASFTEGRGSIVIQDED